MTARSDTAMKRAILFAVAAALLAAAPAIPAEDAAVTGWLVVRGRGASGPFERRYRYTDTWKRYPDGWKIIVAHDTLERKSP